MNTELMAGAFLKCNDKVLIMHRGLHKKLNPGLWAPIGGHLQPHEINAPEEACLREIVEEANIQANSIHDFKLRYIIVRNSRGLIYINYLFFGELIAQCELPPCDEGTLHWVDFDTLPHYPMSFSVQQAIVHRMSNPENCSVVLGAVNSENSKVVWNEL